MDLRKPDYQKAKEKAHSLLKKNCISAPPVDLEAIAESEGLNIAVASFDEKEVSGIIHIENKLIIVNRFDSISRQRFTIAHELGHWILHQNEINSDRDILIFYRKNLVEEELDPLEKEANCFASNLLVPLLFLEQYPDLNIKQLAEVFKVSEKVISFRRDFT